MATTMAKIFISYDRASKDIVEQLVEDLADDEHEIWFDQHLTGGQKWWDNILSEIRQCEILVAALTPAFLQSRACQRELNYAKDLRRIRLPVRLSEKVSPNSLPPDLSQLQWVDYSLRTVEAFRSLQRTLRHLPKAPPLPDPLPDAPPAPISHLSQLREKIDRESLAPQDQIQLVFELRQQFRNGESANEIIDLLHRLKGHDDLYAKVDHEIDDLLPQIDGVLRGAKPREPDKRKISTGLTGTGTGGEESSRKGKPKTFVDRFSALSRVERVGFVITAVPVLGLLFLGVLFTILSRQ
jgi:TIR domain